MPKPTKTSNLKPTNCTPVSSQCVIWEGPDLECIELCHGDTISDVQGKIADLLCDIADKVDLTGIDFKCLVESGECDLDNNPSPTQSTLKDVIACLIKQYCDLKARFQILDDTVKALSTTTPEGEAAVLNVNTTCLNNNFNANLSNGSSDNQIISAIIAGLCTTWEELQDEITRLEGLISTSGSGGGTTSTPPSIEMPCLWAGTKSFSTGWTTFATDYCTVKSKLGSVAVMDDAINAGVDCYTSINNFLFDTGDVGDLLTMGDGSGGLALSHQNLWRTMCALVAKVESMNTTLSSCCGFSCKDFEITANAVGFDPTDNTVNLRLSFDGSSTLPDPPYTFTNAGSSVIYTDRTGYSLSKIDFLIEDENGGTYLDHDITGLDLTGEIQVDIDLSYNVEDQVTGATFSCTKCLHTYFKTGVECAFCQLDITVGDNAEVIITYIPSGSTTENKLTITASGTYIIPAGAEILSVIDVNNSGVTILHPDCPNLEVPATQTLACYSVVIDEDLFDGVTGANIYYNIAGYFVDGVEYLYSSDIRSDLTDNRTIDPAGLGLTNVTSEATGSCTFDVPAVMASTTTFFSNVNALEDIPTNPYIFDISKVCIRTGATVSYVYVNLIISAVSGKNIFLKLVASDANTTSTNTNNKPQIYIKAIELAQGEGCDCCAVYNGS